MPNMEKVIKGLESCKWSDEGRYDGYEPVYENCEKCPYNNEEVLKGECHEKLTRDALALLKKQETKTGVWILDDEDTNSWECSECGGLLMINDGTPHENDWYFCPYCGAHMDNDGGR